MHGSHLTADLDACPPGSPAMTDVDTLRTTCLRAVASAGLRPVGELFHHFGAAVPTASAAPQTASAAPQTGITGVVLLAESHLAVHTWPELGAVTIDVYVCNFGADNSSRAERLMADLIASFAPGRVERHALARGAAPGPSGRRPEA